MELGDLLAGLTVLGGIAGAFYGIMGFIRWKGQRRKGLKIFLLSPVLSFVALLMIFAGFDLGTQAKFKKSVFSNIEEFKDARRVDLSSEAEYRAYKEEQKLADEQKKLEAEEQLSKGRVVLAAFEFETMEELNAARNAGFSTSNAYEAHLLAVADTERSEVERKIMEQKSEEKRCKADLQCWGDKHSIEATFACDDIIPRFAKFSYEWTDRWYEPKFSHFRWSDKANSTVTFIGDKIRFQNGFGAWQDMIYECDYDPSTKAILDARVRPGRL